jgi:hypothetical protein
MIGSNALSCSWAASDAIVIIRSLPITSKATWFITSGMTGLTLPGMIDEPASKVSCCVSKIERLEVRVFHHSRSELSQAMASEI